VKTPLCPSTSTIKTIIHQPLSYPERKYFEEICRNTIKEMQIFRDLLLNKEKIKLSNFQIEHKTKK
jgi:hypothetical protein